jgi:Soluble NSF attachment protein, SNAP
MNTLHRLPDPNVLPRTANQCYKDAADLYAELDQFAQAITLYERVADHSLTSNLTKYSVKEYWLKSLLCALAMKVCGSHERFAPVSD